MSKFNQHPQVKDPISRTLLQMALDPAIATALGLVEGLDLSKPEHTRRFVRALQHIAARAGIGNGMSLCYFLGSAQESYVTAAKEMGIGSPQELQAVLSSKSKDSPQG